MSAARIVQKIPNNPTYAYMVTECLRSLGNRTGSSVPAIKKQLGTQFEMDLDSINQKALTNAIKKGVQAGDFVQIKASYKLNKKRPEPTKKAAASTTKKSSTSTSETGTAAATLKAKKKKVVKKSAKSVSKPKAPGTKKSATKVCHYYYCFSIAHIFIPFLFLFYLSDFFVCPFFFSC